MADAPHLATAAPPILIVEDHDVVRAALRDWFSTLFPDYAISEAGSGEEALPLAAALQPTIVVMDLSLPGMNGIEATRRIKRICPSARVVILTIHEELVYQTEARAAGADAYVSKRDMQTELVPALKRLLALESSEGAGHAAAAFRGLGD